MSDAALIGIDTASRTARVHDNITDPSQQEFVNGAQPRKHSLFHSNHGHKHDHKHEHDHTTTTNNNEHLSSQPETTSTTSTSTNPVIQSQPTSTTTTGSTSRITTKGDIIRSSDPSAQPNASTSDKLKGDVKGAINGTIGSLQAAAGIAMRNEGLEQKGRDKMSEEDARLGVKHGVMPVGSSLRTEEISGTSTGTCTGTGTSR